MVYNNFFVLLRIRPRARHGSILPLSGTPSHLAGSKSLEDRDSCILSDRAAMSFLKWSKHCSHEAQRSFSAALPSLSPGLLYLCGRPQEEGTTSCPYPIYSL